MHGRLHDVGSKSVARRPCTDPPSGQGDAGFTSPERLPFSPPFEEEVSPPRPVFSTGNAEKHATERGSDPMTNFPDTSKGGKGAAPETEAAAGLSSSERLSAHPPPSPNAADVASSSSSSKFPQLPPSSAADGDFTSSSASAAVLNPEGARLVEDPTSDAEKERSRTRAPWLSPAPRVRFHLPTRFRRGSNGFPSHCRLRGSDKFPDTTEMSYGNSDSSQSFTHRCLGGSNKFAKKAQTTHGSSSSSHNSSHSLLGDATNAAFHRGWEKLKAAGNSAGPGATAAAAMAGKHAARLGREAAKKSALKAAKAMKVLKAVQGELDSATRLQRMLGIQKYTEDERLQQLAETETFLSPAESLQYDLKVLQYYTNTEKDIELRNRRAKAFIYTPTAQIVMALVIIFNILFLGISTMEITLSTEDSGPDPTHPHRETELVKWNKALFIFLTVCNAFFAVVFFVEMILRIKCDRLAYFKDIVNLTDFVNAWLGILDLFFTALHYAEKIEVDVFQSVAAVLRLVRLLRVLRFIRILKAFLPMRVLVDGMKASFFSLVYAMCFFIVLVYGFAVFFTTAFGTTNALQEYWGDLFTSMYTLFLILTMTNWDVVAAKTAAYYGWAKAVVILYTVFSFFVLFNVVTAVIVEAFSSAASRLQGEATHFQMFEECQEDEKIFSRALTKGHLLHAVSGISVNQGEAVAMPSCKTANYVPYHHDRPYYREAAGQVGSGVDLLDSTKSTQAVVAPAAPPSPAEKQEETIHEKQTGTQDETKEQQRADEVYVSTECGPAAGAARTSDSCRDPPSHSNCGDVERTSDKPKALGKLPSSLFASFVRPPSSLVQRRDGATPPKLSPRKRLRCVKGVLRTQSSDKPDQAEHKDAGKLTEEFDVTREQHEKIPLFPPTARDVERLDVAGGKKRAGETKDSSSLNGEDGGAIVDSTACATPSAEKKASLRSDAANQEPQPSGGGVRTTEANDFLETSAPRHASPGLREEPLVGVSPADESFSSIQEAVGKEEQEVGGTCGRIYDDSLLPPGSTTTLPEVSYGLPCIDLRYFTPLQVLGTRAVQLAMRKCGISYIQAYDCLNILLQKGFEEVTVAGFLTSCRRVVGPPTARQIFLLELDLDRAFRHLNAKVTHLLSLLQLSIGEHDLVALPPTFASKSTKSGLLS